jgi:phosphate-selective porin OprO and OprP
MSTKTNASLAALVAVFLTAAAAAEAEDSAQVEAGSDGFSLSSADDAWRLELHGLVHFDGRWFSGDSAADDADEWLLRRVRPSLEGTLGERIEFRIMPDFGEGDAELVDAYVDTALGSGVTLRAGKFKAPVGLERLQSSSSLQMVERSFVTELLPNRDLGLALSGDGERLSWSAGLFNGVNDGRSGDQDDDGNQEVALRVFAHPFGSADSETTFGIGVGATYGETEGTSATPLLSGYRSPGQNTVFAYRSEDDPTFADGERLRFSPQFYWYRGPVGLLGEWARVRQDVRRAGPAFDRRATLEHEAWQATAEWFLTGEEAGYRDPESAGAVQLVARIARLDVDEQAFAGGLLSFADPADAVRRADTWGTGVNWRPLQGLKASLVYQQTSFEGGAAAGDRPDEKVVFLRLQQTF